MRRLKAVLFAAVLGFAGTAFAQQATPGGGENGGTAPGEGTWQRGGATHGGSSGFDISSFEADPTGTSGLGYRLSGRVYGATRGPGAGQIQPDRVAIGGPASAPQKITAPQPALGHVPTDQELARGAPQAIVDLGPVPRPELGGRASGM